MTSSQTAHGSTHNERLPSKAANESEHTYKNYDVKITHNKYQNYVDIRISSMPPNTTSALSSVPACSFILVASALLALLAYSSTFQFITAAQLIASTAVVVGMTLITTMTLVVTEETVTVLDIGVQLSSRRTIIGICFYETTKFYSREAVRDVVINEYFQGFEVVYYLCVIVEDDQGEKEIVVVFPKLLPRLATLELVYREIHKKLGMEN